MIHKSTQCFKNEWNFHSSWKSWTWDVKSKFEKNMKHEMKAEQKFSKNMKHEMKVNEVSLIFIFDILGVKNFRLKISSSWSIVTSLANFFSLNCFENSDKCTFYMENRVKTVYIEIKSEKHENEGWSLFS